MKLWLKPFFNISLAFLTVASGACTTSNDGYESPVDLSSKPEAVKRKFKTLTLKNQLDVMLISDPDVKQSAAALNVAVGFGEDPDGQAGMAHFLEHMLFLGTKKFPDEGEYSRYIASHQGYNNAYTTFENTNYFFTINHRGFDGALDRFSQFFIAPLFTPKFVEREKNAVNNEFEKNKQNDGWRVYELAKLDIRKDHPASKFGTGNNETLKSITRDDLMAWHKKYYSANNMTLALISSAGLDEMEGMARKYFSLVENHKTAEVKYSDKVLDESRTLSIYHVKPVKDHKQLAISFNLPPQSKNYKNKAHDLMASLIGSEHPGGLAQKLKAKGWVTDLFGGAYDQSHQFELSVTLHLTDRGARDYQKVLDEVFAYLNFIKDQGIPKGLFYEKKALAETYYVYPRFEEGGNYVAQMAAAMQKFGSDDLLKKMYLYEEFSPSAFEALFPFLKPKYAQIFFSHKDFKPDSKEPIYGTEFKVENLSKDRVAKLESIKSSKFTYPSANPYIPENLELISDTMAKPEQVLNKNGVNIWFQADTAIGLPRGHIRGRLIYDQPSQSARSYVTNQIYSKIISQNFASWSEQLQLAGINLSVYPSYAGLNFELDGFSDKLPRAMADFLEKLKGLEIPSQTFKDQKDAYVKDLRNAAFESAYQQAIKKLRSEMNRYTPYVPDHLNEAEKITLADVKAYHQKFVQKIAVQAVAYGNLRKDDVVTSFAKLGSSSSGSTQFLDKAYINPARAKKKPVSMNTKDNNDAWTAVRFVGQRDPKNEAFSRILTTLISDKYFNDLRTHQQLGYVVAAFPYQDPINVGVQFLIQSSNYPSKELSKRTETWLKGERNRLAKISDKEYTQIQQGLLARLTKPFKTSEEFAGQIFSETFIMDRVGYRQQLIDAVAALDAKTFKAMVKEAMAPKATEVSVFVNKPKSRS